MNIVKMQIKHVGVKIDDQENYTEMKCINNISNISLQIRNDNYGHEIIRLIEQSNGHNLAKMHSERKIADNFGCTWEKTNKQ